MTLTEWKQSGGSVERTTLEKIEAENMYADDGRVPHVPFGFANDRWLALKGKFQPGDIFYYFCSSEDSWRNLAGRSGYMLVRGDEIVETVETMIN